MTYEQRVEAYGDICVKFATLFEQDATKLEQLVGLVLAMEVPKSEEPVPFYLQQIYAEFKPNKVNWLFKQKQKAKKQGKFVPSTVKSKRMNAWIKDLQQLKVPERAVLFTRFYLQVEDGAISELMQTPIEAVRSYGKNASNKLERILQKHELQYIDAANFKKYFDEDFGSTYNVRRRLKQMQVVAAATMQKPKKIERSVPKWLPLAIACLVFFSSLATPFAYHISKKLPFINEDLIEAGIIMNSLSQPYYQTIHDNYNIYVEHIISLSSMAFYIEQLDIDLSSFEEEVERVTVEYEQFDWYGRESDRQVRDEIISRLGVKYEDYFKQDMKVQALFNIAFEQMTEIQQNAMYQYNHDFEQKYKDQIEQLRGRFAQYNATEKFAACTMKTIELERVPEETEMFEEEGEYIQSYTPEKTQLCIMPNGDVTYMFIDDLFTYFEPVLFKLEEHLDASYSPFNYHMFYTYLEGKVDKSQLELELMQMTQILAYAYELVYPGWIVTVPPLNVEELAFPI